MKLYSFGRGAGNTQDAVNGFRVEAGKAKEVLKDAKATVASVAHTSNQVSGDDQRRPPASPRWGGARCSDKAVGMAEGWATQKR